MVKVMSSKATMFVEGKSRFMVRKQKETHKSTRRWPYLSKLLGSLPKGHATKFFAVIPREGKAPITFRQDFQLELIESANDMD